MSGELKADRYEIEQEVGRGGMGVVCRARDLRLNRVVALKMIPSELMNNPELRRRLAQEARAASALTHAGVAAVYDFEERGGESFIVYEFIQGATLREQLKRPGFTVEGILDVGIQLADALAAAHERGIIHRDLKPENIMLKPGQSGPGQVKILDFGLAKLTPQMLLPPRRDQHDIRGGVTLSASEGSQNLPTEGLSTAPGLLVGTVNYMAPEQLERETVDARTDIHALGLVLYEMATGRNPFAGRSPTATIANILREEPPPIARRNRAAPAELDRIARKCLRKRREERYQSAREVQVDLSNLRRDLAASPDRAASTAVAPPAPAPPLTISRELARGILLFIQAGYLIMYGVAFHFLQEISAEALRLNSPYIAYLVLFAALCGTPIRLYLISATGFDYADLGRQFRRLFPAFLFLDLAWAVSPTLLIHKIGGLSLACIAGLAWLPFSQRTLLFTAYVPGGGRSSGAKVPGAL